jgi:hypothetical protein
MIFGTLPFSGNSIIELFNNIKTAVPHYPPGTDPGLVDLLIKLYR